MLNYTLGTIEASEALIKDLYIDLRAKVNAWSKITQQTPQARMGYVGQHLVSVVTGYPGGKSGARGYDLVIDDERHGEIKTCYRVDQLGSCNACGAVVSSLETECAVCGSTSINRKDDSKWLIAIRNNDEFAKLLDPYRYYFVLFEFESIYDSNNNDIIASIWEVDPKSKGFAYCMIDYYLNIRSQSTSKAPFNMWPHMLKFALTEPTLIYRSKITNDGNISERVVQRCLCDNILVPVFSHSFVFDNAASLKGKGVDFAMDRLDRHLHRFYRKFGVEGVESGGVLTGDFSDFFNSAPHSIIYREAERRIHDGDVRRIACQFMEDFGDVGFGLGSQVSQIDALMVASPLDHFIKEQLHIKYYGRYMDDFYLIHENREYLKYCMEEIRKKCKEYGFVLNEKKTKIAPLRKGVKFLKTKFFLNETGAVIRKMNRKSPVKMRKKLRIFRRWIDEGRFTITDVETAYQSWRGHMIRGNSTLVLRKMDAFYNSLFKNKEDSGHGKVSEERQLARAC